MQRPSVPPVSRSEWGWLCVALLLGAALRLGNLSHVAVEHFDEAVYASNLLVPADQGGEYPFRQLYAPPLLPAVIEWTTIFGQMILGDVPDWWPMLPALICGLATIPSAWWIARQWFSPRAGLIAAHLLAGLEFHSAYSRTALTDVPMSLFLLWAVQGFWKAFQTGQPRSAIIAGVLTSLTWWTKYNGWLPLAIAASGGVFWQLLSRPEERNWRQLARVWTIAAVTAVILWLPVVWDCQQIGGYAKVAENHRGYTEGFGKWGQNLVQGYGHLDEFVGWFTLIGVAFGLACRWFPAQGLSKMPTAHPSGQRIAECLAGAWFFGLLVATPLYHSYSRLWTPWLVASCLLIGYSLALMPQEPLAIWAARSRLTVRLAGWGCLLIILCAAVSGLPTATRPTAWERRDGLRAAAESIQNSLRSDDAAFIVGDSDPALWYQLRQRGCPAVTASNFDFLDGRLNRPGYVILGPLSQRTENIQHSLRQHAARLELIEEIPVSLSRVSLLDIFSPQNLADRPELRAQTVQVYRIQR